jgi:hypothetical protein
MRRKKSKPNYRKIILRLPDLDHAKASVLNSLAVSVVGTTGRMGSDDLPLKSH